MSIALIAVRPRLLINASKHCHNKRHSNRSLFIHHNFSHSPEVVAMFCNTQWRTTSLGSAGLLAERACHVLSDLNAVNKSISLGLSCHKKTQRKRCQLSWRLVLLLELYEVSQHPYSSVFQQAVSSLDHRILEGCSGFSICVCVISVAFPPMTARLTNFFKVYWV